MKNAVHIKSRHKLLILIGIVYFALQNILCVATAQSQPTEKITLSGVVAGEDSVTLSLASVFVRETMTGTVTNTAGEFRIRLDKGKTFHIAVQSLGYAIKEIEIEAIADAEMYITLAQSSIQLDEVEVRADENPAFGIMRKAIVNAPLHLNEVESYTANMYIKGSLKVYKIPKILTSAMRKSMPQEGRTYTIESVNRIEYTSPNKYVHTTLAERSALPKILIDKDIRLNYFNFNFYNSSSSDVAISPLSPKAFSYYKFEYTGYSVEFGKTVNHIKVIPRLNSKQLFEGMLHIVDGSWQLAHVDLDIETAIGNINVVQNFVPIEHELWMLVFQDYTLDLDLLGVVGQFNYMGATDYSDVKYTTSESTLRNALSVSDVHLTQQLGLQGNLKAKRYKRNARKLTNILDSNNLENSDIRRSGRYWRRLTAIADTTRSKLEITDRLHYSFIDSVSDDNNERILDRMRLVPLTESEKAGFEKADTIIYRKKKIVVNNEENKRKILGEQSFALGSNVSLIMSGLNAQMIYYHPVTGVGLEQDLGVRFQREKIIGQATVKAAYAFAPKQFIPSFNASVKFGGYQLRYAAGRDYVDWKGEVGEPRFTNSISSVLLKKNRKVLVEDRYQHLDFDASPVWGMNVNAYIHFDEYIAAQNNTNFSIFKRKAEFDENVPVNKYITDRALRDGRQAVAAMSIEYTPRLRYYTNNAGQRVAQGSAWPTFYTQLRVGIGPTPNVMSNFRRLSFAVSHKKNFALTDKFDWELGVGVISDADGASFADWKHFAGSKKLFAISDINSGYKGFVMFEPYRLSTNDWYTNMALHYQSQSLLIKRIPAFSHWLYTEEIFLKNAIIGGNDVYTEVGYGLGHILLILRTTLFVSFVNKDFDAVNLRMSVSIPKLNDK